MLKEGKTNEQEARGNWRKERRGGRREGKEIKKREMEGE